MSRLSKLFRNNVRVTNAVALRAGGGIPRPDVPTLTKYEHKRLISIYDLNIWWYDNSMPEYLVTLQDQHLHDHINTLRVWGNIFPWLAGAYVVAGIYYFVAQDSRVLGTNIDFNASHIIRRMKKYQKDRLGAKRHFLNLNNTGEDGNMHFIADAKGWTAERFEKWLKADGNKKQMLTEAKGAMTRIEKEIREKHQHHGEHKQHH